MSPEPSTPSDWPVSQTPGVVLAGFCAGLCLVLFVSVGAVVTILNLPFGLWFTELFIFGGVAWELTRLSGRDPGAYTKVRPFSFSHLTLGLMVGLVNFIGVVAPLQVVAHHLLEPRVPDWLKQDPQALFQGLTSLERLAVVAAVSIAAPLAEELAFRGVIQQGLQEHSGATRALIITAVIFSAFHLDAVGFPARVELGLLFGLLLLQSRSLWTCIGAHAANNAASAVLLVLSWNETPLEDHSPPLLPAVAVLAVGSLLILALLRVLGPILQQHIPAPRGDALLDRPRSLWPALVRWGGAAVLCIAALAAVDARGIQLNWIDVQYPLSKREQALAGHANPPLSKLRAQARRGEVPVGEYRARRKEFSHVKR
jgi:membrane protease YdiL (CAAX protease family)